MFKTTHGRHACLYHSHFRRFNGLCQLLFVNDAVLWNGKKRIPKTVWPNSHIDCHKFIFQLNALSQNKNRRHLYMRTIARETYAWLHLFLSHPFGIFINFVLSLSTNAMRSDCMIFFENNDINSTHASYDLW